MVSNEEAAVLSDAGTDRKVVANYCVVWNTNMAAVRKLPCQSRIAFEYHHGHNQGLLDI